MAALTVVSCTPGDSDSESPATPLPETANYTTSRWIENPAVDLMSPDGTFIRAVMEAQRAADLTLVRKRDALDNVGFPGFARAFNNPERADNYFSLPNKGWSYAGTDYYEVVKFSRDGETRTAGVCNYKSMTASKPPGNDLYETVATDKYGFGSVITYSPNPDLPIEKQHTPPAMQRGPANRPTDDVFGTWVITDITPLIAGRLPCGKPAPGTPPDRPDPFVSPEPPPSLPPQPGWPGGGVS